MSLKDEIVKIDIKAFNEECKVKSKIQRQEENKKKTEKEKALEKIEEYYEKLTLELKEAAKNRRRYPFKEYSFKFRENSDEYIIAEELAKKFEKEKFKTSIVCKTEEDYWDGDWPTDRYEVCFLNLEW